jgi:hypothetical protein
LRARISSGLANSGGDTPEVRAEREFGQLIFIAQHDAVKDYVLEPLIMRDLQPVAFDTRPFGPLKMRAGTGLITRGLRRLCQ